MFLLALLLLYTKDVVISFRKFIKRKKIHGDGLGNVEAQLSSYTCIWMFTSFYLLALDVVVRVRTRI
jgi:hypothetical protein